MKKNFLFVVFPAIFAGAIFHSLTKPFFLALTILAIVGVAQIVLSLSFSEILSWEAARYRSFNDLFKRNDYGEKSRLMFILSGLLNITKVANIFGLFFIIIRDYKDTLNPFGEIGFMLVTVSFLILALIIFKKRIKGKVLNRVGVIWSLIELLVLLIIACFLYLTFASNLIWITVLSLVLFIFFSSYFSSLDETSWATTFFSSLIAIIILIASLITQFWKEIGKFFLSVWNFLGDTLYSIGRFLNIEILPGFSIWLSILVLLSTLLLIAVIVVVRRARKIKKEEEKERKIKEQEMAKMLVEQNNKIVEAQNLIKQLRENLSELDSAISLEGLVNLAKKGKEVNYKGAEKINIKALASVNLLPLLEISKIKGQITWSPADLESVINLFDYLYEKSYNDEDLVSILKVFKNLLDEINPYKEYIGYSKLERMLQGTSIPMDKDYLWEGKKE